MTDFRSWWARHFKVYGRIYTKPSPGIENEFYFKIGPLHLSLILNRRWKRRRGL